MGVDGNSGEDAGSDAEPSRCEPLDLPAGQTEGPRPLLDASPFIDRPQGFGVDVGQVNVLQWEVMRVPMTVLSFDVVTFEDRFGYPWRSNVVMVVPELGELAATDAAAYVAQTGTSSSIGGSQPDPTWGSDHPAWFVGTQDKTHLMESYASVALDYGIPIVFGPPVPKDVQLPAWLAEAIAADAAANGDLCHVDCAPHLTHENIISDCLRRAVWVTKELTYDPYLNYSVAQQRILDAAEHVLQAHYQNTTPGLELDWTRVWTIGNSKRGNLQRILAAFDDRLAGSVVGAADISHFSAFFEQQFALWEGAYSFNAERASAMFETGFGETILDAFDTVRWKPELLEDVIYLVAVGTHDPLFPLPASMLYSDALPQGHRYLLVPNYGHGMGTVDHLAAFRAMVDHGLNGASWPRVEAWWDWAAGEVVAQITQGTAETVQLWCAESLGDRVVSDRCTGESFQGAFDRPDLRQAVWSWTPMMEIASGTYRAEPLPSALQYQACVVRVVTEDQKVSTSGPLLNEPLCQEAVRAMAP